MTTVGAWESTASVGQADATVRAVAGIAIVVTVFSGGELRGPNGTPGCMGIVQCRVGDEDGTTKDAEAGEQPPARATARQVPSERIE
ncbi:MAG: hypothetical protein KC438_01850 [Thermomicrobiales bacterium]|nr:hypothetical protein [Thermomicrobiales bacterium]MCO5221937.1 hypothetical protein [Thermomicrobiales bacterium]